MKKRLQASFVAIFVIFATPVYPKITTTHTQVEQILNTAHALYKDVQRGQNANYIPALAKVDSDLFGIAIVTAKGKVFVKGDVDAVFSIQSISKVFTLSLAIEQQGPDVIKSKVGVNATGLPFNSVMAIELNEGNAVNPLVNAGALATVSLLDGNTNKQKWSSIAAWYNKFANRELTVLKDIYQSESANNGHNRAIAELLKSYDHFYSDVDLALDVYTRQCSMGVTTKDLAMMAAVLANDGVQPLTNKKLMEPENVSRVLATMTTAGLYETSGDWAYQVGLPAKSGVGGGIIAVVPGQFAIAVFSPKLDPAGNSVRAQLAIDYIAKKMDVTIF